MSAKLFQLVVFFATGEYRPRSSPPIAIPVCVLKNRHRVLLAHSAGMRCIVAMLCLNNRCFVLLFRFWGVSGPGMWCFPVKRGQNCGRDGRLGRVLALAGGYPGKSLSSKGFYILIPGMYSCLMKSCLWVAKHRLGFVYQDDLLRGTFACEAEVTHCVFCSFLPPEVWQSCLWRLPHHRELGPISRSLFPQVRKHPTDKHPPGH